MQQKLSSDFWHSKLISKDGLFTETVKYGNSLRRYKILYSRYSVEYLKYYTVTGVLIPNNQYNID